MTKELSLFEFQRYRDYLRHAVRARGKRTQLAAAVGCHNAYVSRVLDGAADFSLEQAYRINQFLGHTDNESAYFLLLVQYGRAGSPELRAHFEKQITELRARFLDLKNRVTDSKRLDRVAQSTYYSAWYYAAIHVATAVPKLRTIEALSLHFNLPPRLVATTLEFLESIGSVVREGGGFLVGTARTHIDNTSDLIRPHHTNWRLRAIDSLHRENARDLHYSAVITLSEKDLPRVKAVLLEAVEKIREVIRESPDERVYCYALDLFDPAT